MNPTNNNNNNCLEDIRNKLLPYVNVRNKDNADHSAKFLYGKFLSYTSNKNFAGASLTKRYLKMGKARCKQFEDNRFKFYYSLADKSEAYSELKQNFINYK